MRSNPSNVVPSLVLDVSSAGLGDKITSRTPWEASISASATRDAHGDSCTTNFGDDTECAFVIASLSNF